ncbi:hypothetical protein [Paenibacillus sp. FSL R5-0519]|uniref:hypothetical protein n=1 Tax=Paenibacillus sp. FSL R5-0519 TaxID=2921648 RepID=UPI0030D710E1
MDENSPGILRPDHNADSEWNESMESASHNVGIYPDKLKTEARECHMSDKSLQVGRAGDGGVG